MPLELDFSSAIEQRERITKEQQKTIHDIYKEASEEIGRRAEQAPRVPSDYFTQQYLCTLQGQINDQLKSMEGKIGKTIKDGMVQMSKSTVDSAKQFLSDVGMPIKGAYSHVPADIVRSVASGQLYKGDWTLSKALWLNTKNTQTDIQAIVAKGIAENKSAYDIAKDLEKYVNPDARKDWDWGKVYPGTRKVVDYNAQRLARTMVSHAYQQAFVRTTIKNPFVTKYQWQAAGTERTCEICNERDGQYYPKDELPLDHPNGMCTFLAVIEDSMEDIADRLADWAHGGEDPELDAWAKDLYGKGWQDKKEETQVKQDKAKTKSENTVIRDSKWADKTYKGLKKNIESVYGKDTWEALKKDILSKPEHIQDWVQRWTNKVQFATDGDKAYQTGMMIYMQMAKDAQGLKGRDPFSVFYHELGHYIDKQARGTHGAVMSAYDKAGATDFYKILQKEYSLLLTSSGKLDPNIKSALRGDDRTSGVQDVISGLSLNANKVRWGHSTEYWQRKGADSWKEVTSETFANMNSAYCMPGSGAEKAFQTYFPESYQYFQDNWVNHPELFYAKG